ncbi:MAG: cytochrome c oxidase subunit 3 [Deltaproteobacteria bacterium]|nr:cytochrome c oxidase subunit 3 [Deltaproteobacteria bacterium]
MDGASVKQRDYAGAKLGMWLFLATELFLFLGPFLLYYAYRHRYGAGFSAASAELNLALGALNTAVLLTSSLTMALSISAVRKGNRALAAVFLVATILLGLFFLFNKYMEWSVELGRGMYPGSVVLAGAEGEGLFFGLYYLMTGVHGLHVLGGVALLGAMLSMVLSGKVNSADFVRLENSGLYWHFVDIIWIYLFPFFYLVA